MLINIGRKEKTMKKTMNILLMVMLVAQINVGGRFYALDNTSGTSKSVSVVSSKKVISTRSIHEYGPD